MSEAKQCDRCGGLYKKACTQIKVEGDMIVSVRVYDICALRIYNRDICDICLKELLKKFLKSK